MLTGPQLRVKVIRNRIVPQYLDPDEPTWRHAAGQLIDLVRDSVGRTRGELNTDLEMIIPAGPEQIIWQGLAKLLDDRCETESPSDPPPEELREQAFRLAAEQRKTGTYRRAIIVAAIAEDRRLTMDQVDRGLFADLKDQQRTVKFETCSVDYLLRRYNVALAQGLLVRSVGLTATVRGESPPRYRQLFRAAKFHKLLGRIESLPGEGYRMTFDGPLSLFAATQKYGLQLALFLPTLMHCRDYELSSTIRWGAQRKERQFHLSTAEGIESHTPDFGQFRPRELEAFATTLAAKAEDWTIDAEPTPVPLGGEIWVPDFRMTEIRTGRTVDLEVLGYWRKTSVSRQLEFLRRHHAGRFLLLVGDQYRADDEDAVDFGDGVVKYKKNPNVSEVLRAAAELRPAESLRPA